MTSLPVASSSTQSNTTNITIENVVVHEHKRWSWVKDHFTTIQRLVESDGGRTGQRLQKCTHCGKVYSDGSSNSTLSYHLKSAHGIGINMQGDTAVDSHSYKAPHGTKRIQHIKLLKWLVKNLHPINTVEEEEFHDMVKVMNPAADIPCRQV